MQKNKIILSTYLIFIGSAISIALNVVGEIIFSNILIHGVILVFSVGILFMFVAFGINVCKEDVHIDPEPYDHLIN